VVKGCGLWWCGLSELYHKLKKYVQNSQPLSQPSFSEGASGDLCGASASPLPCVKRLPNIPFLNKKLFSPSKNKRGKSEGLEG